MEQIYKQQDEWYIEQAKKYGVALESGQSQTKFDWMLFTAASSTNPKLRQIIYNRTALWLRETPAHVPFSDRGDVVNGAFARIHQSTRYWRRVRTSHC